MAFMLKTMASDKETSVDAAVVEVLSKRGSIFTVK